jgi:hypothetical protein
MSTGEINIHASDSVCTCHPEAKWARIQGFGIIQGSGIKFIQGFGIIRIQGFGIIQGSGIKL